MLPILETFLFVLLVLGVTTQITIPLITSRPLFPLFSRRRKIEKELIKTEEKVRESKLQEEIVKTHERNSNSDAL